MKAPNETNAALAKELVSLLRPTVAEVGLFLEKIVVKGPLNTRVVEVYVDLPAGTDSLDSARLEEASRAISARLDEVDPVEGAYNLEVSTLGAEHILDNPRLFSRALGKSVEVKTGSASRVGTLESADSKEFSVNFRGKVESFTYQEVESVRSVIAFGGSSKPGPGRKKR